MPRSPFLLLVALVAPASASASPTQLVADCNADGDLDARYSASDYRAVLSQSAGELNYSGGCGSLFRQGLLTNRTIRVRARVRRPGTKTRATVTVGGEKTSFIVSLKR